MDRRGFLGAAAAMVAAAFTRREDPAPVVVPVMGVHDTMLYSIEISDEKMDRMVRDALRREYKIMGTASGRMSSRRYM